ncbi:MAG TPA: GldG family protein [Candidatus Mediterraneibacter excrementipullorum]|nr:GldG family protein [Candidatus Mediterraneibacter excrementipullorum]
MKDSIKNHLIKIKEQFGTRSSKVGSYSFFLTAIVLAILITVNYALSFLPDSYAQEDLTANQLYSISSQSKVLLSSLEEDITIYWIVAAGEEDEYVEKLLHNYEDYSSHINVEKKDPDLNPDFTNSYTDEEVYNNSIIVECGDKYRYISYEEMYEVSSTSYYSIYSSADEFSGEKLITSAISYCTTDELPVVHILEGHGEAELTSGFTDALEADNLETENLSLLNGDSVPDDVKCILINAPSTDISEQEKDMLIEFLEGGGRILILSGTNEEDALTNLNAVAGYYGISVIEGVVIEESQDHYVFNMPVLLMPDMESGDITDPLIEDNYHVIMPMAKALDVSEPDGDTDVTPLLTSSEESFIKEEGYNIETYDKEDGDTGGPLTLAALVTKDIDDENQMQLVWTASSLMLEEAYNQYSSDANEDFVLNILEMMCEKDDSISVRSKSLTNEYLTISTSDSSFIKVMTIGIIPAAYLLIGVVVVVRRKRR